MKLGKAQHKVFLYNLFFDNGPQGRVQKTFSIQVLPEASSSMKKLLNGVEEFVENGTTLSRFSDEEIELSIDEAKFLKDLLGSIKEATVGDFVVLTELKELFI